MKNEKFHRYCVVRVDETGKKLTVKHYKDFEEYENEIDIMAGAFEHYKDAVRECKRVAKMCGGECLLKDDLRKG
jgi:hypothetical protein